MSGTIDASSISNQSPDVPQKTFELRPKNSELTSDAIFMMAAEVNFRVGFERALKNL